MLIELNGIVQVDVESHSNKEEFLLKDRLAKALKIAVAQLGYDSQENVCVKVWAKTIR